MTRFGDNIFSGNTALTSAAASRSPVWLVRTHRFTQPAGGGTTPQTQTGTFPSGVQNLDANLYIMANASATVSDRFTVSAAGTNYMTITGVGSATGVLRATTAGLGTLSVIASACANLSAVAEVPYSITFVPASASKNTDYQLSLTFNRITANLTNLS